MLGDGINDGPVLAGADVAVAMGGGSALAQTSADMVLTRGHLGDLTEAIGHARRTLRVIRQNLAWAAGYNILALPLAAAGMVPPWMAARGMSASSLRGQRPAARTDTAGPHSTRGGRRARRRRSGLMNVLFLLIPVSLILVALAIAVFFWAVRNGQFDDLETPAYRILMDTDETRRREREGNGTGATLDGEHPPGNNDGERQ